MDRNRNRVYSEQPHSFGIAHTDRFSVRQFDLRKRNAFAKNTSFLIRGPLGRQREELLQLVQSATATASPVLRFVSMAYWSQAESIMRKSLRIRLACERLRARRKPGTAIAAKSAIMATTIMISTRVNPLCDFAADVFIYIE